MNNKNKKSSKPKKSPAQDPSSSLQGWPGYRTRQGRSGLDPVDNEAEGGHMAGVLIRRLLTGKLRTSRPSVLLLWMILGLGCIAPFLLAILEAFRGDFLPAGAWVLIIISCLLGTALLVNLARNRLRFRDK